MNIGSAVVMEELGRGRPNFFLSFLSFPKRFPQLCNLIIPNESRSQEVGGTLIGEDGLVVMAGVE